MFTKGLTMTVGDNPQVDLCRLAECMPAACSHTCNWSTASFNSR